MQNSPSVKSEFKINSEDTHIISAVWITLAAHVILLLTLFNIVAAVLFYTSRGKKKIRMDYSKDLNPFETWPFQQYYKFFFTPRLDATLALI